MREKNASAPETGVWRVAARRRPWAPSWRRSDPAGGRAGAAYTGS